MAYRKFFFRYTRTSTIIYWPRYFKQLQFTMYNSQLSCSRRLFLLPKMTPDGCRVLMVSYATGDSSKYDLILFAKRLAMLLDVKFHQEAFDRGMYVVVSGANFTLYHALQLSPKLCYNLLHCLQVQCVHLLDNFLSRIKTLNSIGTNSLHCYTLKQLMVLCHIY